MLHALVASLTLAAASTLGDLLWAGLSLTHRIGYGLLHGAVICLVIGAFVGWRAGATLGGVAAGPVIGVCAAGVFYILAPWLRYYAMFPAWMFFWIAFAILQKVLDREPVWVPAGVRGVAAALLSGLAFYAISGIWTDPPPDGPNYAYNFGAWTFAFFPGFACLFAVRTPPRRI